tara:strand:- start:2588 stop:3535 length:948 start_codon:yes stop_codon:yes gene_type:complete
MNNNFTPLIKPKEILKEDEIEFLKKKNDKTGSLLILHAWFVILLCVLIYSLFPNIVTFFLAVVLIGGRQLGLAILMHEGAHGLINNKIKTNDFISQWFCAFPVWLDTYGYRHYHLSHHRHTQKENDPDLSLSKPFPISKMSFLRKVLRDLSGISGLKQKYELIFKTLLNKEVIKSDGKIISGFKSTNTLIGIIFSNLLIFLIMWFLGEWWYFFVFWLLPLITFFQLFLRIRNIAEHAGVKSDCDDLNNARTTYAGFLERALVAPYYVNYHLEHHLLMFVPCYKLKRAHQMLLSKGFQDKMEIKTGYISLLKSVLV